MKHLARTSRILSAPTLARLPPGAEWCEAVIRAGCMGYGGPPHGSPERWDWGVTLKTLELAIQRHQRLQRIADDMTPEQKALLWQDTSPIAEQLRRFVRW